jgi:para-aminobenzoate synthetase/4-amino-4-deoxychorismate lyase
MSSLPPFALFESLAPERGYGSRLFSRCLEIVEARSLDEVLPALRRIEGQVAKGLHAAGFIAYEAAAAFDRALPMGAGAPGPLLRFGVFALREEVVAPVPLDGESDGYALEDVHPGLERGAYLERVARIRELIAAGDCYQANLTFPLRFRFHGSPAALYRSLCRAQRAPLCALVDLGDTAIASASPELFFRIAGRHIETRPMKGTARRCGLPEDDQARADALHRSEKDRAENVMIVDLMRNDLGRICEAGSIHTPSLFEVERYETVHQMTSTVAGVLREGAGVLDVLQALFPCGSVTGAPKRRAMEILSALEGQPRGLYTGALGYLSPGMDAVFAVAIRTAVIDQRQGEGALGIGSGITWDSDPDAEHAECLDKARFFLEPRPELRLVETLRMEGGVCSLLPRHLARLARSAAYFGFRCDLEAITAAIEGGAGGGREAPRRLRVLLDRSGAVELESGPLPEEPRARPVAFASAPVDAEDLFLFHKTTHRPRYERERREHPELYDVLFVNARGELTEGTFNNIALRFGNRVLTPPVRSGLLPGVLREELLERGAIEEAVLTLDDLARADELLLMNAVRGVRSAQPVFGEGPVGRDGER